MKKISIPIIIAAVLLIAAVAVTALINKKNAETERLNAEQNVYIPPTEVPEDTLKLGKYYLNGDKNADLWVEITPETFLLNGSDVDASIKKYIEKKERNKDMVQRLCMLMKRHYCHEKEYIVQESFSVYYNIIINRTEERSLPEDLTYDNTVHIFFHSGENYIRIPSLGKFIFTE